MMADNDNHEWTIDAILDELMALRDEIRETTAVLRRFLDEVPAAEAAPSREDYHRPWLPSQPENTTPDC